jgi:hypothetical protein
MARKQAILLVLITFVLAACAAGLGILLSGRDQPLAAVGSVSPACVGHTDSPANAAAYMDLAIDALWADCSELFYRSLANMGRQVEREGGNPALAEALRGYVAMDWDDFGDAMDRLRELTALNDPIIDELLTRVAEWEAARDGFVTTVAFPQYEARQGQFRLRVSSIAGGFSDQRNGFFNWRPGETEGEILAVEMASRALAATITFARAADPGFLFDIRGTFEGLVAGAELQRVESVVLNNLALDFEIVPLTPPSVAVGWETELRVRDGAAAARAFRHAISLAMTFVLPDGRHAILELWFNPEEHPAIWEAIAARLP